VALAMAGCGSSPSSAPTPRASATPAQVSPVAAVRQAAAATAAAGSSRFSLANETEVQGTTVSFSGTGVFDRASRSGSATFQLPGGAGTLEERFLGDQLFLTVPGQPGFYRLSVAELGGTSLGGAADPTAAGQQLVGVSDDVVEVGKETVRDTPTTHYRGTLDVQKTLSMLQGVVRELSEKALAGTQSAPIDVWIDQKGVLRRFSQKLDIKPSAATRNQPVTTTTTLELYDFGVQVNVQPPPADQVKDGAPLLQALRAQAH
jgi:hypothetical protein